VICGRPPRDRVSIQLFLTKKLSNNVTARNITLTRAEAQQGIQAVAKFQFYGEISGM